MCSEWEGEKENLWTVTCRQTRTTIIRSLYIYDFNRHKISSIPQTNTVKEGRKISPKNVTVALEGHKAKVDYQLKEK